MLWIVILLYDSIFRRFLFVAFLRIQLTTDIEEFLYLQITLVSKFSSINTF